MEGMDPSIQAAVRKYMDRSDVLVVTKLQCKSTGQQVTVGNIHVTWGEMKVPDVQSLQVMKPTTQYFTELDTGTVARLVECPLLTRRLQLDPRPSHTKDFKDGTSCSFAWRSALRKSS